MADPDALAYAKFGRIALRVWKKRNLKRTLDLTGANLAIADLSGADLRGADCTDANFSAANLNKVDLRGACLVGACFDGAFLNDAKLEAADLSFASFREASMCRSNVRGANIMNANLIGVKVSVPDEFGTDFSRSNLRGVILTQPQEKRLTGSFLQFATANGFDSAIYDREVIRYMESVLTYTTRDDIPEALDPSIVDRAVANAQLVLGRE